MGGRSKRGTTAGLRRHKKRGLLEDFVGVLLSHDGSVRCLYPTTTKKETENEAKREKSRRKCSANVWQKVI